MEANPCNNRRSNLLLLLLIASVAANLVTASAALSSVAVASEEKVKLALYYEALCPFCENFIVNSLSKLFDNGLISIVDLKLSPYGNAKIRSNGTIVCQHGEWECILNTVEACAIHAWPALSDHFPFIYCVENLTSEGEYAKWETCFEKVNVDPKPVMDCYTSGFGHELDLQYADEIKALEPPHTYVPWVVLDGQPLYDDYYDVFTFICKAYKGSNIPEACYKEQNAKSKLKSKSVTSVSFVTDVGMAESM
ncbi:hypothetical protein L1887_05551 [Cichorium endivia]|nr:hypothetical protein L1887_05551 [Cichorium endivia]